MTLYKQALIWTAVNDEVHPMLSEKERTVAAFMPMIAELFPGINYYSITGFCQVMRDYVQPVLMKQFPEIAAKKAHQVTEDMIDVKTVLPSKGYEHLDNPEWKKKLEEILK